LRRASRRDWEAVLEVREACIRSLSPDFYTDGEVEGWLARENAAGTRERLERGTIWAGLCRGRVVGYSCGVPGEVEGLFVHPDFQGVGLGRRLLQKAEEPSVARREEFIRVISTHNAKPFYRAQGYRSLKVVSFRFPSGLEIEAHELRKDLR
jgi:putative acetyltransferase